jgi:small subunit ribosomal protein S2
MPKLDAKTLLEAGVHFGHRTNKWNPKMKPHIFEARNGIYVINLSKTLEQLDAAAKFLKERVAKGGKILFVGCKKQAQALVKDAAKKSQSFYVTERWLGGTLTNLNTIRRSVARMRYIDELETSGKFREMPKQEVSALRRESAKIHRNLDGIANMDKIPDVLVVIDITREDIAVKEARRLNIPIVDITDTNADPTLVDYPIAGNDDAIRSISVILDCLNEAVIEGSAAQLKSKADSKAEREEKSAKAEKPAKSESKEAVPA